MARSLLRQLAQVSGSATYDDALPMAVAETADDLSLEKDLNFIRSQLKVVTGETNWFDVPNKNIVELDTEDGYINTFIGKAAGSDTPNYSSEIYITDGDSLETAIGKLDAAINVVAPDKLVEDIVAAINAETAHTLPHSATYTLDPTGEGLNMDLSLNGQLLAVDSGSVARDYAETSTTQVTFHFTVEPDSNLIYLIRA
jgi:hypothetical protein